MSNLDDVARVREIKRLLDRIQQLPLAVGDPGNGVQSRDYQPSSSPPQGLTQAIAAAHASNASPYREELGRIEPRTIAVARAREAPGISPWLFVMATALNTIVAAVLAVVITLGVVHREPLSGDTEQAALSGRPATSQRTAGVATGALFARSGDPAESAPVRPVELAAIGSRGEPLNLEALKPSRLPLHIRPEEALQETYILVLSGLPANATLSGANRMGSDSWLVPPGALTQLEIIMAEWSTSLIEVGVELRRTNGQVAAHNKAWFAVPPPAMPQGAKLDQAAIEALLQGGDRLLGRGDVVAARALYERAAAMGSGPAALALGSTYDPNRLWSLGVFGMVGNKERARQWYSRAQQLGHPEAEGRLRTLKD